MHILRFASATVLAAVFMALAFVGAIAWLLPVVVELAGYSPVAAAIVSLAAVAGLAGLVWCIRFTYTTGRYEIIDDLRTLAAAVRQAASTSAALLQPLMRPVHPAYAANQPTGTFSAFAPTNQTQPVFGRAPTGKRPVSPLAGLAGHTTVTFKSLPVPRQSGGRLAGAAFFAVIGAIGALLVTSIHSAGALNVLAATSHWFYHTWTTTTISPATAAALLSTGGLIVLTAILAYGLFRRTRGQHTQPSGWRPALALGLTRP